MLNWRTGILCAGTGLFVCVCAARAEPAATSRPAVRASVPILYSSDLLHPHDDPDDHFDLATLFAIPEFDIRAVVLDLGERQAQRPGTVPLKQMMHLTGRTVPFASGLVAKLKAPDDKATDQPAAAQGGVELILKTLREAPEPITIFETGSLRDIAAAFNREPDLLRAKVRRLYVNTGHSGGDREWNVDLDPHAFVRVMGSRLPIWWVPCFGPDGYNSFWKFRHNQVLETAPPGLQCFFIYALNKTPPQEIDPIRALKDGLPPAAKAAMWEQERNMWCTAALLHAAGRPVVPGRRIAWFEEKRVRLDANGATRFDDANGDIDVLTFRRIEGADYDAAMTTALRDLLRKPGP